MQTRIYVVKQNVPSGLPQEIRLVEAASQSQAIRHVVAGQYIAEVAGTKELVQLMAHGARVEQSVTESAKNPPPEQPNV